MAKKQGIARGLTNYGDPAFSLYLRGVKLIGGYVAMLLTSFEPLTATVISILWLHISFGLPEVIGGLLIVSTIFLLPKGE